MAGKQPGLVVWILETRTLIHHWSYAGKFAGFVMREGGNSQFVVD
jgi:hypothetical protein